MLKWWRRKFNPFCDRFSWINRGREKTVPGSEDGNDGFSGSSRTAPDKHEDGAWSVRLRRGQGCMGWLFWKDLKSEKDGCFLGKIGDGFCWAIFYIQADVVWSAGVFFGMIVWLFVCQKRANRVILLVETAMSLQPNQFNPFAKQCSTFKRHLKVPALLQPTLPPWHAGGDTKASRPWSCQVRVTSKFRLWWQMLGSYAPG